MSGEQQDAIDVMTSQLVLRLDDSTAESECGKNIAIGIATAGALMAEAIRPGTLDRIFLSEE